MTDPDLVAKKLAAILDYSNDLRAKARPALLETDVRERRFIEHTLQLAIQAALDVASHIVSDERLGEPRTNRQLFASLEASGWIDSDLSAHLQQMAGFRNVLVHGYDVVDLGIVRDVLEHRLDDLTAFVRAVEARMSRNG